MRYMHGKVYFNKDELKALEVRNPTLFELAQEVAEVARIVAKSHRSYVDVRNKVTSRLLCPSQVFGLRGVTYKPGPDVEHCNNRVCWGYLRTDKTISCWLRQWNEFVDNMRKGIE